MTIEPFQAEWREDSSTANHWRDYKGNVVVSFFGHEIYASPLCEDPSEYTLEKITDLAIAELGNLIGEKMDKRIEISEYDGLRVKDA
jgi:hypothetical protein